MLLSDATAAEDTATGVEVTATEEEDATTTLATDEASAEVATAAPDVHVETEEAPVGVSAIASSALTQPDFAVRAAGQATCSKVTPGLSELPNQSKRQ